MSPRTLFGMLEYVAQTFASLKVFFLVKREQKYAIREERADFIWQNTGWWWLTPGYSRLGCRMCPIIQSNDLCGLVLAGKCEAESTCMFFVYIFWEMWTGCSAHGTDKYLETQFWFSIVMKIVSTTPWGAFVRVCLCYNTYGHTHAVFVLWNTQNKIYIFWSSLYNMFIVTTSEVIQ